MNFKRVVVIGGGSALWVPRSVAQTAASASLRAAAVVRAHQVTFELAARGVVERNPALLKQAIQLCPFGNYLESAETILQEARREWGVGAELPVPRSGLAL